MISSGLQDEAQRQPGAATAMTDETIDWLNEQVPVQALAEQLTELGFGLRIVPAVFNPDPDERQEAACWFDGASELHVGVTADTDVDLLVFMAAYELADRMLPAPVEGDLLQEALVTAHAFRRCVSLGADGILLGEAQDLARSASAASLGQVDAEGVAELPFRLWTLLVAQPEADLQPLLAELERSQPRIVSLAFGLLRATGRELGSDETSWQRTLRALRTVAHAAAGERPSTRERLAARPPDPERS